MFSGLIMEPILQELETNKDAYRALTNSIRASVRGRICHHHVVILNALVRLYPIHTYLEIGVHNGTSMSYIVNQLVRPIKCIGIDLFSDTTARYAHDTLSMERTYKSIDAANVSRSEVKLVKGNSRAATTVEAVRTELGDYQVDLLFIDGDHEFAGVESDFLLYSGLVRKGGFVVFDDVNAQYPGILKCIEKHVRGSQEWSVVGLYQNTDLIVQRR
jgi:predicted O-methyltransferase YrrM